MIKFDKFRKKLIDAKKPNDVVEAISRVENGEDGE